MTAVEPAIRFENVNKWFGSHQVLKGINFHVTKGEKVVLCGPSGSGKSTLIRCINRLEAHQDGNIIIDGLPLTDATKSRVRANIGMVFQSFNLFPHLTIEENCMVAPVTCKGKSREQAREIASMYLSRVKVGVQAQKYPSQLSGG